MRHLPHHRAAVIPTLVHKIETRGDRYVWTPLSRLCVNSAATAGTLRYNSCGVEQPHTPETREYDPTFSRAKRSRRGPAERSV